MIPNRRLFWLLFFLPAALMAQVEKWVVCGTGQGARAEGRDKDGVVFTGAGNGTFVSGRLANAVSLKGVDSRVSLVCEIAVEDIANQDNAILIGFHNSNATQPAEDVEGTNPPAFRDDYGFVLRLHSGVHGQNRLDISNPTREIKATPTLTTFNAAKAVLTENQQPGGFKQAKLFYTLELTFHGVADGIRVEARLYDGERKRSVPGLESAVPVIRDFGNTFTFDTLTIGLNGEMGRKVLTLRQLRLKESL